MYRIIIVDLSGITKEEASTLIRDLLCEPADMYEIERRADDHTALYNRCFVETK